MDRFPSMSLVIGYGNSLRSDDGVGQLVATAVERWQLPQVRSRCLHQLTPEVAEELSWVDRVIFVDARVDDPAKGDAVNVLALEPLPSAKFSWAHYTDPRSLITLAQTLYGKAPQAFLVSIPGVCFDLGDRLSPKAQQGMNEALEAIAALLTTHQTNRATSNKQEANHA